MTQTHGTPATDRTFCSCGCDTVVMVGGKATMALAQREVYKLGELDYIELFVQGHESRGVITACPARSRTVYVDQPTVTAVLPSTCPGCSGSGVLSDDPQVLRCTGCGGVFTDTELPITAAQAIKFVAIHLPMVANAGPDGQFYFDLELSDGRMAGRRVHGWADRKTKRVVQWG